MQLSDDQGSEGLKPSEGVDEVAFAQFREYRRTGDRGLRNEIVEQHLPLAKRFARRFAERGEPLDDLEQVALVGLIKSVERFDPSRGLPFAAFASPTILGELKRHFRDHTWAVKVPRRASDLRPKVQAAVERLSHGLGRSPTIQEIASDIGEPTDMVIEAIEIGAVYRSSSLSDPHVQGIPTHGVGQNHQSDSQDVVEHRVVIKQLMSLLDDRDRQILELRFYSVLTQDQIAQKIGISQMHVSRRLRGALEFLQQELRRLP